MTKCPKCTGELSALFSEHMAYPVMAITNRGIGIDVENGDRHEYSLLSIRCNACGASWKSLSEFLEARHKD